MAIIECAGRFVRTETAFKLRDAVTSQTDARVVVLDLTEVHAIGGGGLGMLVLLQKWAQSQIAQLGFLTGRLLIEPGLGTWAAVTFSPDGSTT